ncbi:MAG TPA: AmmeMemoRadiSam system protein B [Patescibacteria group bacterium]|nr:AmmeMemoRadiSam system protein B [Patescibacteria group bacterium]
MSLVFAALTPHPPLLIPSIGKEMEKKVEKTKNALLKLEEELYLAKPEVIIIISPHGALLRDAFTINYCADYETDLREFGDLATKLKFKGETTLPAKIRSASKAKNFPATMVSEHALDHGVAVPLYFLTPHLPHVKIMPMGFSNLDAKTHLEFGYLLKEQIMKTNKRVAVIASGDLSHALTTDAPAGFNEAGPQFDATIQELLATHNTGKLLSLDGAFINNAAECGFRSILILLGVLRNVNYTYESLAYEGPFGVGYLTAHFAL